MLIFQAMYNDDVCQRSRTLSFNMNYCPLAKYLYKASCYPLDWMLLKLVAIVNEKAYEVMRTFNYMYLNNRTRDQSILGINHWAKICTYVLFLRLDAGLMAML